MTAGVSDKYAADRSALVVELAEVFRAHGYEGASMALFTEATGMGKGSLYHYFPGGKEEMAQAVLRHIDHWFAQQVFVPLRELPPPEGIARMLAACGEYFLSGRKVCLVGVFAMSSTRERFAEAVKSYFIDWGQALDDALRRAGHAPLAAADLTEEILGAMQGALVLARAIDDPRVFMRTLDRLHRRTLSSD